MKISPEGAKRLLKAVLKLKPKKPKVPKEYLKYTNLYERWYHILFDELPLTKQEIVKKCIETKNFEDRFFIEFVQSVINKSEQ